MDILHWLHLGRLINWGVDQAGYLKYERLSKDATKPVGESGCVIAAPKGFRVGLLIGYPLGVGNSAGTQSEPCSATNSSYRTKYLARNWAGIEISSPVFRATDTRCSEKQAPMGPPWPLLGPFGVCSRECHTPALSLPPHAFWFNVRRAQHSEQTRGLSILCEPMPSPNGGDSLT